MGEIKKNKNKNDKIFSRDCHLLSHSTTSVLAGEGANCEDWDESTSSYFPDCELGLECKSIGDVFTIPGAGRTCQKSKLDEFCEGHNESTGMPYADCEDGLECRYTVGMVSIPGADKTC